MLMFRSLVKIYKLIQTVNILLLHQALVSTYFSNHLVKKTPQNKESLTLTRRIAKKELIRYSFLSNVILNLDVKDIREALS